MTLQPVETLLAAVLVLLLGHLLNRLIPPLAQYNIPAPISGGLLFALGLLLAGSSTGFSLEFDVTLRPVLLLSFFAAVGLSANLALLRQGGKRLLLFVMVISGSSGGIAPVSRIAPMKPTNCVTMISGPGVVSAMPRPSSISPGASQP